MQTNEIIGRPIRSLQTMLRVISNYNGNVLPVVPDGIYGKDTQASVSSFQQEYFLPVTGVTDLPTWNTISEVFDIASINIGPAAAVRPSLQPMQVISLGQVNNHLYMMNGMLLAIAEYFPTMPKAASGNILELSTALAVKWIQKRAHIEETGNIDRNTWRFISQLYRLVVRDGTRST